MAAFHVTRSPEGGIDELDTDGLARRIDAHLGLTR
jgi:hypothetical protein